MNILRSTLVAVVSAAVLATPAFASPLRPGAHTAGTRVTSVDSGAQVTGTRVTGTSITPAAAPGRYCDVPDPGWVCFYQHSGMNGNSVGFARCGWHDIPSWLDVSSYWENQTGGAYTIAYDGAGNWLYSTSPGAHDVPWSVNDRTRLVYLAC